MSSFTPFLSFLEEQAEELHEILMHNKVKGHWVSIPGGVVKTVLYHRLYPDYLLKFYHPYDHNQNIKTLQTTVDNYKLIDEICQKFSLDLLVCPQHELVTQLNNKRTAFLIEERLSILSPLNHMKHLRLQNDIADKKNHLATVFEQLAILVYHTKLIDLKPNNIMLLTDLTHLAIIDVEDTEELFNENIYYNLIHFLYSSHITAAKEVLRKQNPDFFATFNFDALDHEREREIKREIDHEVFWKKKYRHVNAAINCPREVLNKLDTIDQKIAKRLLVVLNAKLANSTLCRYERQVLYKPMDDLGWDFILSLEKTLEGMTEYQQDVPYFLIRRKETEMIEYLIKECVLFAWVDDDIKTSKWIYC